MGIFCGRELCELLKVGFSQLKLSRFVGNDGLWVWLLTTPTTIMRGQETTNEIELGEQESELESYKVVTVDRGYYVHVAG